MSIQRRTRLDEEVNVGGYDWPLITPVREMISKFRLHKQIDFFCRKSWIANDPLVVLLSRQMNHYPRPLELIQSCGINTKQCQLRSGSRAEHKTEQNLCLLGTSFRQNTSESGVFHCLFVFHHLNLNNDNKNKNNNDNLWFQMNSNKDACVKWRALCILTLRVFVFFCTLILFSSPVCSSVFRLQIHSMMPECLLHKLLGGRSSAIINWLRSGRGSEVSLVVRWFNSWQHVHQTSWICSSDLVSWRATW